MRPASDYLTLLQLAVGLNLVVGAYGAHRKNLESRIADEIDASREKIDEILDSSNPPVLELKEGLERKEVKNLSDRELARYFGDTSIRFYKRVYRFGQRDNMVEPWLVPIGLLCLFELFYASLWPKTMISYNLVYLCLILGFVPALWVFLRLVRETAEHERFYRRQANSSYRNNVDDRHAARLRSEAIDGEIFRATNQIRVRYREFVRQRRKGSSKD
jgi:hypothetical protein